MGGGGASFMATTLHINLETGEERKENKNSYKMAQNPAAGTTCVYDDLLSKEII